MMKKAVFIVFLGIVGLSAISAQTMPNPWIECGNDISCGAAKAGFNFPLKVENYTVRAMKGMLELRFPLDEKRNVIVRKSTISEGEADENGIIDISGDYNQYPVNKTVTLENGVKFGVRGEENNYKVVNFAAESGYYSIMCGEGLHLQDIEHFYKLLEEAEAPRFSESPYFAMPDVFEMKSNENLTILSHYPTFQQTTEYSCGPAAALTVLEYYGKKGATEEELIEKMGASIETGTSVKGIANYFRNLGWNVKTNLDGWQPLEDYEPFAAFVQEQLKSGHPIMVENVFKGGHWRVIIGYDTMGTKETADDVLIFADTYDTADHNQDGYGIENGENFFWSWFDHQILPEDERKQPFVLTYPKEKMCN